MADLTIADVRKKFPQYSDLSDQQLADALHKKYYADIPQEQFYQKIGFAKPEAKPSEKPEEKPKTEEHKNFASNMLDLANNIAKMYLMPGKQQEVFAKTLEKATEGVGHATDVMGEKTAEGLAKHGVSPEIAAGAGTVVKTAGDAAAMLVGGGAGAKAGEMIAQPLSKELMQSAIKPTIKQLKSGEAATAIQTMLDKNIPLSGKGVEKLREEIGNLNDQITEMVKGSPETVDKNTVASYLQKTLDDFKNQVNPESDIAKIKRAWDEFINHPDLAKKETMSLEQAQKLKQGTYKQLAGKYGEVGSAETEAQKTLARGLKEEVAKKAPQVKLLTDEETRLIRTLKVAERRVLMDANKNPAGLALLAKDPAAMATFMLDRSPRFKEIAARMLYRYGKQVGFGAGAATGEVAKQIEGAQ